jgi:molybdopterin-guanine dinucleotide biosynthesis protein A
MGAPKERLLVAGETLLHRTIRILAPAVGPIVVAARQDQEFPELPEHIKVVIDARENGGPLMGVSAGMEALARDCSAVFVVACDHPMLSTEVVRLICRSLSDEHDAVVPIHDGRSYPLTACYRISMRHLLSEMMHPDQPSAREFASRCRPLMLGAEQLSRVDPDLASLWNVNDPGEYEKVKSRLEP